VAAPFDTLKLARALRDRAGFSQKHAEAAADALAQAVTEQVSTRQEIDDIRSVIEALRIETKAKSAALRAEIAALRNDRMAGLRDVEQRMTIRLGGMPALVTGSLLAAKIFG
jgi:predicted  nucleic acid-binding Zn-ribbon protein